MNILLIALLAAAVAGETETTGTKTHPAPKKKVQQVQSATVEQDPVTKEYEALIQKDEAALGQIEKIVAEFEAFSSKGAAGPRGTFIAKIDGIINEVKKAYEDFLQKNPKHVDGLLAYGSFLNETGDEEGAIVQWEKAREIDPKNPSPWNNLANIFGHIGPIKKAFQYYEKAIELDPKEPVYVQNLATTTYLFRKDAVEMYRIDEEGVFNKALDLYKQAMKLDPTNLVLATDYAQSYYGIKPLRTNDALAAWKHCLTLAKNDVEKEGIYLHLARVELNSGLFEEAEKHLDLVKDPSMDELKNRLQRNLEKKQNPEAAGEKEEKKAPEKAADEKEPEKTPREAISKP